MQAMKGITYTIAPILSSYLFKQFENNGVLISMPFIVCFGLIVIAFPILCFPLRSAMIKFKKIQLGSKGDINAKDRNEQENRTPLTINDP